MPIMHIHLNASEYSQNVLETMLADVSQAYVTGMYPDMDPPPIERVRIIINDVATAHWATGGIPVSRGGVPAPFFTILSMKGRSTQQLDTLMARITKLIAQHLGCDAGLIRGMVTEIAPEHWYIAGTSATTLRGDELAARAAKG